MCIPQACLSRPEGHLWSAVFRCRLLGRLDSLPPGITVEGKPPEKGMKSAQFGAQLSSLLGPASGGVKRGVAPSTFSPFLRHHLRRTEGGRPRHNRGALGGEDAGKPASCNGFAAKP